MAGYKHFPGYLTDFPRGTTVPIRFTMQDEDEVAVDVTGGKVYLAFAYTLAGTVVLEVEIDPLVAVNGTVAGEVTGTESLTLVAGNIYYSLKFIDTNDKPYTFDMGKIKILPAVNVRIIQ